MTKQRATDLPRVPDPTQPENSKPGEPRLYGRPRRPDGSLSCLINWPEPCLRRAARAQTAAFPSLPASFLSVLLSSSPSLFLSLFFTMPAAEKGELIHGLTVKEVDALSKGCLEARQRAYCMSFPPPESSPRSTGPTNRSASASRSLSLSCSARGTAWRRNESRRCSTRQRRES